MDRLDSIIAKAIRAYYELLERTGYAPFMETKKLISFIHTAKLLQGGIFIKD